MRRPVPGKCTGRKAQPVQGPQGKRAHSYRFLELPQVCAARGSARGGVGIECNSQGTRGGGESMECDGAKGRRAAGIREICRILASPTC